jgi:sugar O-acyltransferase (sialic acid O-acetyltransferase NeuD family)
MSKLKILLVGAGGHAKACIDVIELEGKYEIVGLVGIHEELNSSVLGYPVIGSDRDFGRLSQDFEFALVTAGQIETPEVRIRLFEDTIAAGFKLPTIISPIAQSSKHAQIGIGSIVMHGAIVNAGAKVGKNCIINTRALIEHDATISNHCHVSTRAIVNGEARIGLGSFIGSGSIIKQGIEIGNNCVIGMGLSVRQNYPNDARVLKS